MLSAVYGKDTLKKIKFSILVWIMLYCFLTMIQALPKLISAEEFLLAAAIHKHSWGNHPIQRE